MVARTDLVAQGRDSLETFFCNALGGRRAPWLENKIAPSKQKEVLMFNIFKQMFDKDDAPEPDEYASCELLMIDITLEGLTEIGLGTEDERESISKIEQELVKLMPEGTTWDGHDYGEDVCTIYFYGKSADDMFKGVREYLERCRFAHIDITLQYGMPDDPKTTQKNLPFKSRELKGLQGRILKSYNRKINRDSQQDRDSLEKFFYDALGGKRAPWLENKIKPPKKRY